MKINISLSTRKGPRHNLFFGAKNIEDIRKVAKEIFDMENPNHLNLNDDYQLVRSMPGMELEVGYDPEEGIVYYGNTQGMRVFLTTRKKKLIVTKGKHGFKVSGAL